MLSQGWEPRKGLAFSKDHFPKFFILLVFASLVVCVNEVQQISKPTCSESPDASKERSRSQTWKSFPRSDLTLRRPNIPGLGKTALVAPLRSLLYFRL